MLSSQKSEVQTVVILLVNYRKEKKKIPAFRLISETKVLRLDDSRVKVAGDARLRG